MWAGHMRSILLAKIVNLVVIRVVEKGEFWVVIRMVKTESLT